MTLNPETMKRLAVFSFAFLLTSLLSAQTIKVTKKNNRIKDNLATGFALELNGKAEDVEDALPRFLKDYGKTRSTSDYVSVLSPALGDIVFEGNTLYATSEGTETKSIVWIGLDTVEWRDRDVKKVLGRVEKLVYQFGVKFYRDQIQKDIDESQQAFDATEKQQVRLTNQNKDLNLRLGNNEQERIHLEKAVEVNKLEKAVILQKIENNKKSQDSVFNAGVQIKKVLEMHKARQTKVN
jgi:predicted aspartyl protease